MVPNVILDMLSKFVLTRTVMCLLVRRDIQKFEIFSVNLVNVNSQHILIISMTNIIVQKRIVKNKHVEKKITEVENEALNKNIITKL